MHKVVRRISVMAGAAFLAVAGGSAAGIGGAAANAAVGPSTFHMVRSAASVKANCLIGADARVTIQSEGPVEVMSISADHLPPNTDFDLFVTQVPNAPFGISWYQGDLESNRSGHARGIFIGRFNVETFAVAPGTAAAPQVFNGPFPDASANPPFNPVQMYHLGLWFNSPKDAAAAGCAGTVTPFNGEHNAGVQALSTNNFPDQAGPLRQVTS